MLYFEKQVRKDHLLSLQERRINRPFSNMRGIKEGDVVILKEEGTTRCVWKLVRIISDQGERWSCTVRENPVDER